MKKMRKKVCVALLATTIGLSSTSFAETYTVKSGDSFWKIGNQFGVSLESILKANNANKNTTIYPGQVLNIPGKQSKNQPKKQSNKQPKKLKTSKDEQTSKSIVHTVVRGDSLWKISRKYNVPMSQIIAANKNLSKNSIIYIGEKLNIPGKRLNQQSKKQPKKQPKKQSKKQPKKLKTSKDEQTSKSIVHTVVRGDSLWKISKKYNVSMSQIIDANKNLSKNSIIYPGQKLNIPISGVQKEVPQENLEIKKEQTGEYLDWFKEVDKLMPIGTTFRVIDYYTGKSFNMKRTIGAFHADVEALTMEDTQIIKEIWGGFSWVRRPVLVQTGNRLIAASMTAMPHAGNDKVQGGVYTKWRSGGYGPGTNFDYIKGNGMNGHVDIHFAGSKRHKDGRIDAKHQQNVKIAAGMAK